MGASADGAEGKSLSDWEGRRDRFQFAENYEVITVPKIWEQPLNSL